MKTRVTNNARRTSEFNCMKKHGFLPSKVFHFIRAHGFIFNYKTREFLNNCTSITIFKNPNQNNYSTRIISNYDGTHHCYGGSVPLCFIMQISRLLASIKFAEPDLKEDVFPKISKKHLNIELIQIQDSWEVSDSKSASYLRIPQKYGTKILSKIWIAFNTLT